MLLHNARLSRICLAFWIGLLAASLICFTRDTENSSLLKRGDFPGFYVLAEILERGEAAALYDSALQRRIENEIWPSMHGEFYMSVYPPYLARVLQPLAWLTPLTAQLIFTASMLAAFALCILLLRDIYPGFRDAPFVIGTLMMVFAPVFYGIFGAQNTAWSMLLYTAAIHSSTWRRSPTVREFSCGAFLGLWLFKPQFGLLALPCILCTRSMPMLLGWLLPAAAYYLLGWSVSGPVWPIPWSEALTQFSWQNFIANRSLMVSIIGTAKAAALWIDPSAAGRTMIMLTLGATVLSLVLTIRLCGYFAAARAQAHASLPDGCDTLALRRALILFGPALVLISPQTLFYDLGIMAVSVAHGLPTSDRRRLTLLAILAVISAYTFARNFFPVPLFWIIPVWAIRHLREIPQHGYRS